MTNIYFISEKTLREQSLINDNVESTFISCAIKNAQMINLQEVIGSALYDSLCEQIKAREMKSEIYTKLMDEFVQPYLVNRVMADICVPLHYKMRNSGIVVNNDQHYQSANLNDVTFVKEHYEHQAVFYANRMVQFILAHKDEMDEIKDCSNWIKLSKNTTKCPIYFRH